MDSAVYNQFKKLIHERMGIDIGNSKKNLIVNRLNKRLRNLGLNSYEEYYHAIQTDRSLWADFEDAVTTNHTYFFREERQFHFLTKDFFEKQASDKKQLNIWCAASSSGQEPYSILMTLARKRPLEHLSTPMKMLATDLSDEVLSKAYYAKYTEEELERVDLMDRLKFFDQRSAGEFVIKPNIRNFVDFNKLNLTKTPYRMKGPFEYIFIRNVMIYFNQDTIVQILKDCHRLLAKGGLLFLGSAETLPRSLNHLYKAEGESIYRCIK